MNNLCDECGANAVNTGKSRPLSVVWGDRNYYSRGICDGCEKPADVANYPDITPPIVPYREQAAGMVASEFISVQMSNPNTENPLPDLDLIPQCCEIFRVEGKASVVLLQRRLRLGYIRACWLIDECERRGYIGRARGNEPREVFPDKFPVS